MSYQIRDTKHVSLSIFRQMNEYTMFTQNLGFRGAVTLAYEGKIVAFQLLQGVQLITVAAAYLCHNKIWWQKHITGQQRQTVWCPPPLCSNFASSCNLITGGNCHVAKNQESRNQGFDVARTTSLISGLSPPLLTLYNHTSILSLFITICSYSWDISAIFLLYICLIIVQQNC